MTLDTTCVDTINGFGKAFKCAHDMSGGFLGGALLLVVFILFFIVFSKGNDFENVLIFDGLATSIIAGLLYFGGALQDWVIAIPFVISIIGVGIKLFTK